MRYAERPLPTALDGLVASLWTLSAGGDPATWIAHEATPDGCIELIRRTCGRSDWDGLQPELFVTGLSERPVRFEFSGDAALVGIKPWPWAWEGLGAAPCPRFSDTWQAVAPGTAAAALLTGAIDDLPERLVGALADTIPRPELLVADDIAQLRRATGLSPRELQRWFATHIGLPPSRWLRLQRFRRAMLAVQRDRDPLAAHAADTGYADQPHMTREFGALAGTTPGRARIKAVGPFLPA